MYPLLVSAVCSISMASSWGTIRSLSERDLPELNRIFSMTKNILISFFDEKNEQHKSEKPCCRNTGIRVAHSPISTYRTKHTYRTSATRNWIMYDSNLTMSILFILNTNSHHTLAVLSSRIGRFMNVLYIAPSAFCPQLITTSNHQTAQFTLWC